MLYWVLIQHGNMIFCAIIVFEVKGTPNNLDGCYNREV